MTQEELIYRKYSKIVLDGGMQIWDRWRDSKYPSLRKMAIKEKAKALVNHDRFITGEITRRKPA